MVATGRIGVEADAGQMTAVVDFRLYLITDRRLFGTTARLLAAVEESLSGGLRVVQLREKDLETRELLALAYAMREITKSHGALLFVNDRVDIALAVGADGVHLGGKSMPVAAARKASEGRLLIGVSTHGFDEAHAAEAGGADFITVGPVYETASKMQYGRPLGPETLADITAQLRVPVFAIGGITVERVPDVRAAGAYGAALISGILASEQIKNRTEEFMRLLQ